MRVKATEMEKIFGLSANGIRLYEKHGIIAPERQGNDYRSYGEKELMAMGYALQLRRFGFSMSETVSLMEGEEASSQDRAMEKRAREIEREIEELQLQRKTLLAGASQIRQARERVGEYRVEQSVSAFFLGLRRGEEWMGEEAIRLSSEWISAYSPHTFSAVLLDGPYLEEPDYHVLPQYGLLVPGVVAMEKGFLPSPLVTYVVPRPAIETCFYLCYEKPEYGEILEGVRSYAHQKKLTLQGGALVTIVSCVRQKGSLKCLALLQAPLKAEDYAFGVIR